MVQESLENSPSNNEASGKNITKTNSKGVSNQNNDVDSTVAFDTTSPCSTLALDERSQSITVSPDSFPALPHCYDEHERAEGTHSHGSSSSSVKKDYNDSILTTSALLQRELVEEEDPNELLSPTKDTLPADAIDSNGSLINYALETISPIQHLQTPVTEKQCISSTAGFNEIPSTPTTDYSTRNLNEIQTPFSPYLTKSIASHIRTAEKELKQSTFISPDGENTYPLTPFTPSHVPSDLASYIESAEKEFEDIVKDTLTSPVRIFPTLEMSPMKLEFQQLLLRRRMRRTKDEKEAKEVANTLRSNNVKESDGVQKSMGDGAEKETRCNRTRIDGDYDGEKENIARDKVNIQESSGDSSWQYFGRGRASIYTIFIACRTLLLFSFVMGATLFLSGGFIYPAYPLLFPNVSSSSKNGCANRGKSNQCNPSTATYPSLSQKFDASIAAASFGFATTIRTVAISPLIRLHDKAQPKHSWAQPGFSNLLEHLDHFADKMEQFAHQVWEDIARHSHVLGEESLSSDFSSPSYKQPPELDLGLLVPCQEDALREYLLTRSISHVSTPYNEHFSKTIDGPNTPCRLRDVITHGILMDYVKVHFDANVDLATNTLLLRNVWHPQSLLDGDDNESYVPAEANGHSDGGGYCSSRRRLTLDGMMTDPQLSNILLPNNVSDAANTGYAAVVPDVTTPTTLSQFIRNILSGALCQNWYTNYCGTTSRIEIA